MKINIFKTTTIIDRENASKYIHSDEAELPSSIIVIQERAFFGCFDLKNVNLSECNRLQVIGNYAFCVCNSLKELKFPKGITKIEGNAFKCCINLEKIDLSECEKLEIIGNGAFSECKSLEEIVLPKSISFIGGNVFKDCRNLKKSIFLYVTNWKRLNMAHFLGVNH